MQPGTFIPQLEASWKGSLLVGRSNEGSDVDASLARRSCAAKQLSARLNYKLDFRTCNITEATSEGIDASHLHLASDVTAR